MKTPKPTHREAVALFRLGVIGDLLARDLERGELKQELIARARKRYRPPGVAVTRRYHYKTLERWYYEAKKGHPALEPKSRQRGHGLALDDEQRSMLLDMRREHRSAAAELILAEAVRHGIVVDGQVSLPTLRRVFRDAGLCRLSKKRQTRGDSQRRRWETAKPGDLWHGDVAHVIGAASRKTLVHGLMDDHSRFGLALEGRATELERDMLEVFCGALLRYPPPSALYLDNGSCYSGDLLALVCKRLGIRLVHATPHDPEARGKTERFWRTMRQRCTDHLPANAELDEVGRALHNWLDADYHRRQHASLMGDTPRRRFLRRLEGRPLTPAELAEALEVTETRIVRKDGTFSIGGVVYEVAGAWLARKRIEVVIDGLTGELVRASWKEQSVRFGVCDPVANRSRRKPADPSVAEAASATTPFNPIAGLLERAREEHSDE